MGRNTMLLCFYIVTNYRSQSLHGYSTQGRHNLITMSPIINRLKPVNLKNSLIFYPHSIGKHGENFHYIEIFYRDGVETRYGLCTCVISEYLISE